MSLTPQILREVEEAVANPDGAVWRLVLFVGDEEVGGLLLDGEWGQSETPISLDATLATVLPARLEHGRTRLLVETSGHLVEQLVGHVTDARQGEDLVTTDLLSASAGAKLGGRNPVRLDERVEYPGWSPERIAFDALRRLPYGPGQVEVEPVGRPILTFAGAAGFKPQEAPADILSRVGETVLYEHRDAPDGGTRSRLKRPPGTAVTDPLYGRAKGVFLAQDLPGWRRPARVEEHYREVAVYRERKDGQGFAFPPARAEVEYRGLLSPPIQGTTLWIDLADETDEAEESAAQIARDRAALLASTTHADGCRLPGFDPLAAPGWPIRVEETAREDGDLYERAWELVLTGYAHRFDSDGISTAVTYEGTLAEEERVRVPMLLLPGRSPGVIRPPYGLEDPYLYFEASVPWVRQEGDELVFVRTEGLVAFSGDEVVIDPQPGLREDPTGAMASDARLIAELADRKIAEVD